MAISFHPKPGDVLICDYDSGFKPPEMVKKRLVVIASPRRRSGSPLYTVVPLSTTPPMVVEGYHHQLSPHSLPGHFSQNETWAKCDMLNTVSATRLDRVLIRYRGQRKYVTGHVTDADWETIQRCIMSGLGIDY